MFERELFSEANLQFSWIILQIWVTKLLHKVWFTK